MINTYIALDLETTGVNPANDKIIEIGMAKVEEGKITAKYQKLIQPQRRLDNRIVQLTGITNEMLQGAPVIEEVIDEILDFIGDAPLLGHNIIFDYSFLKKAALNQSKSFEKDGIDTLKLARRLLPEVEHKNLEYLCEYFEIDAGSSHRAYDDAVSAMKLYQLLADRFPQEQGLNQVQALNYSVKKDTPITLAQKRYLTALMQYHKVELEEEIDGMTKSRASQLIDGIISEYGKMPYQRYRR